MSKSSVGLMEQAHDDILSKQLTAGRRIPEVKIAEALIDSEEAAAANIIVTHRIEANGLKEHDPADFFDSYQSTAVS